MTRQSQSKPATLGRTLWLALLCHAVMLMQGLPLQAQVTVAAPSVVGPAVTAVTGSDLAADFSVAAGSAPGMSLVLPETLTPLSGGAAVPARWSRADSGTEEKAGLPMALQPGTLTPLHMEAVLPDLGRYAAWLIVRREGAADQVLGPYVFARAPIPLPPDFLPATLRQATSVWPWLPPTAAGADARILVAIPGRNTSTQAVSVKDVSLGALSRQGATDGIVAANLPVTAVTAQQNCGPTVAPGGLCTVELAIPGLLTPGRYGLDVMLSGSEGGVSATRVTLEVRAPGWVAALVVALGALIGAAVAHWREVDRPRALVELPLVVLAEDFRRLARGSQSREVAALARDRTEMIETGLRRGRLGLTDTGLDATALGAERNILRRVDQTLSALAADAPMAAKLAAAAQVLIATLRADPWVVATSAAALTALEEAWQADGTQSPIIKTFKTESADNTAQITLPTGVFLPDAGADVQTFVRRISRMDLGSALFMAVVIGFGGVAVLWVGNPVWGSGLDLVSALAAGVATRLTLPSPAVKPFG